MRCNHRGYWVRNGLSLVLGGMFLFSIVGQFLAGRQAYMADSGESGAVAVSWTEYVTKGHFVEAVFENWESEFLQMGAFVLLTVVFRQQGSSESKGLDGEDEADQDRWIQNNPDAPWPVRRKGLFLRFYEHSLSMALLLLFAFSFLMHAVGGVWRENEKRALGGLHPISIREYVVSSQFWFESFQNWQSEFLSVLAIVVLSIFLRERGSPQSKPVAMPHWENRG